MTTDKSPPGNGMLRYTWRFACVAAALFSTIFIGYVSQTSTHSLRYSVTLKLNNTSLRSSSKTSSPRYYVYPEESISLKLKTLKRTVESISNEESYRQCRYPLSELAVHEALARHELRTYDPDQADFFIVPTPISAVLVSGCRSSMNKSCTDFEEAFDALSRHELFQKDDGGKHHIVIGLMHSSFTNALPNEPLARIHPKVRNMIIASRTDPMATWKLHRDGLTAGSDFCVKLAKEGPPVSRASFSIGQGLEDHIPLVKPSMDKFREGEFFLFYRTQKRQYNANSTVYRMAPFGHEDELAPCSVGGPVPFDEWLHDMSRSQFCLVMRGDDPSSHSFLHAIRSGCIPVVVSDFFEPYGAPFKSILNMSDFSVTIKEADFMSNPGKVLNERLRDLSESVIRYKLQKMEEAQRVIFPDHPESEFVPSFLKEAEHALAIADELEADEKDRAARDAYNLVKARRACKNFSATVGNR